jgi:uncharacterized membrane protein
MLVVASMLAALIFVITFLIAVPVPSTSAYVNIGDSVIYCAGMLVGAPWAAAAAGIGSMLADWAFGVPIYMPATLIIKGLMGFVCAKIMKNGAFPRFVVACITGGAIMVLGYGAYEAVFMGGWGYVTTTLIANLIQWAGGVIGAVALYYPVKRIRSLIR